MQQRLQQLLRRFGEVVDAVLGQELDEGPFGDAQHFSALAGGDAPFTHQLKRNELSQASFEAFIWDI